MLGLAPYGIAPESDRLCADPFLSGARPEIEEVALDKSERNSRQALNPEALIIGNFFQCVLNSV